MQRPIHFEVHAEDPRRAMEFYKVVLGWRFSQFPGTEEYWLIETGEKGQPGINGGLSKRKGPAPVDGAPVNAWPCTVSVLNIDRATELVKAAGGLVLRPKTEIPGVGVLAYVKDTEGNIFGMIQTKN